ncbi:carbohydrate ABC transporter permease [Fodinicola acaciae]|uniref:carbohydrate ABC transporter permease n=1 Tax=Fodinicola acaciae TaxID=2681555 RepID=UPI0013D36516|nr:sugar ABC transporter permease [Fodinicola acaciae]
MRYGKYRFILSFLLLPFVLYLVFVISPYLQAFYIALTDWQGFSANASFVGLANFVRLFQDPIFWIALKNNLFLLISIPIIVIVLALFFSSMINFGGSGGTGPRKAGVRGIAGGKFYQVVYFFPCVLSVTVIAVLWQFVYEPKNGLLNGFLSLIGLDAFRQVWLGDDKTALAAVLGVSVWGSVGFYVVLFTAAMGSVPRELYESGLLDGANRLQTFWHLTLPLIWDAMQVAIVHLVIGALDTFALVQILTVGPGGPDNATNVVALYLFDNAFTYSKFGYASAIGVTMFALTLVLTIVAFRLSRRERVEY